ncbi:MAG: Ig-like domain-containing protein, partial [Patescibacteria group bacterium]
NKITNLLSPRVLMVSGVAMAVVVFSVAVLVSLHPKARLVASTQDGIHEVGAPVTFKFTLPVSRMISVQVSPSTYGELSYADFTVGDQLARSVTYTPEVTWLPGTTYTVTVNSIRTAWPSVQQPASQSFTFTTVPSPAVRLVTPDVDAEVSPTGTWQVALDRPQTGTALFEFTLNAAAVPATRAADGTSYTVTPAVPLNQGSSYTLRVLRRSPRYIFGTDTIAYQEEPQVVWEGMYTVQQAPGIVSLEPTGNLIALAAPVTVTFSEPPDEKFFRAMATLEPSAGGTWQVDGSSASLAGAQLASGTAYTLTLKAGLSMAGGGYLTEDVLHHFTTIGPVQLQSSYPADGSTGIDVHGSLKLTFDQPVDHASAAAKFSITPGVAGDFSWEGDTLVFKPTAAFSYSTTYRVRLASGITGTAGFNSTNNYTASFSTELSVTRLDVAFHRQEHRLSCEVATLVMALRYRGVTVSEATLISAIGFDPTQKQNGVWGNPHAAFVGDIDGHQPSTGYGVYWEPIARAATRYRTARSFTGWNITHLTAEIQKGNPVIVWGTAGTGKRIDWKTSQGGTVVAVSGEHTRIVIGYIGPADNPTKIITLDPLSGEKHFTRSSFDWNWGLLNNSGVVVE